MGINYINSSDPIYDFVGVAATELGVWSSLAGFSKIVNGIYEKMVENQILPEVPLHEPTEPYSRVNPQLVLSGAANWRTTTIPGRNGEMPTQEHSHGFGATVDWVIQVTIPAPTNFNFQLSFDLVPALGLSW